MIYLLASKNNDEMFVLLIRVLKKRAKPKNCVKLSKLLTSSEIVATKMVKLIINNIKLINNTAAC